MGGEGKPVSLSQQLPARHIRSQFEKSRSIETGPRLPSSNCFGSLVDAIGSDWVVATVSPLIAVISYVEKNGIFNLMIYADAAR